MEYKVITDDFIQSLEELVNKAIKDGWIPQGGIFYTSRCFMQAMIKEG